jgi:hypothetical protein
MEASGEIMRRLGITKRAADVPTDVRAFAYKVSKADILEALYDASARLNDAGVDDESATVATLKSLVRDSVARRRRR